MKKAMYVLTFICVLLASTSWKTSLADISGTYQFKGSVIKDSTLTQ